MSTPTPSQSLDRALGCLWGLALGDALGMPTQTLSRAQVAARYGQVRWFQAGAPDHPLAPGLAAGTVTDDTEQALLLAGLLGSGGSLDEVAWAHALTAWEDSMRARGSLDLLGPSTRRALDALRSGVPAAQTGVAGTTDGAAMRIAPVGIAVAGEPLEQLIDAVVATSRLTHSTSLALGAAGAVAAAVSTGIGGADLPAAITAARAGAAGGAARGRWIAGGTVAARLDWAVGLARSADPSQLAETLDEFVGTSLAANESVPCAFALVTAFADDPWRALCAAASLGGDSDTIGAIAGVVLGAAHGMSAWPADAVALVGEVNGLQRMTGAAERLIAIREGG